MSKLNKYVFCNYSESEQQIVLYNTYTQEMCMIESSDGNIDEALQKLTSTQEEYLSDHLFFEEKNNVRIDALVESTRNKVKYSRKGASFTIHLSYGCNMKCSYCYQNDVKANLSIDDKTEQDLYFFFENKEQLFSAIVDEPLAGLKKLLIEHFRQDSEYMSGLASVSEMEMDHSDESDMFIDHIYDHRDSFILLLNSSENTVYENCVDEFVEILERSIPVMMSSMKGYTHDEYMSHWMAHLTIDAFINVIKHIEDREEAKRRMRPILNYLVKGWVELVMVPVS